jgi:hypothetical protein
VTARGLALSALLLGACSSDTTTATVANFDRPADVAYGCIGSVKTDAGTEAIALPTAACGTLSGSDLDAGVVTGTTFGYVAETPRGDVMVAKLTATSEVRDSDPTTPGNDGLHVGSLPVGIATTSDGCHVVTVNRGSCDLGLVHVLAAARAQPDAVSRLDVTVEGTPIGARPEAIATAPSLPATTAPAACPAPGEPATSHAWIAYPSCALVARVDLATGAVVGAVSVPAAGAPAVIDPADVTCPAECGAAPTGAAAAGPIALTVEPGGERLFIGAAGLSALTVVDLAASGAPLTAAAVPLEDAGGLRRLAATGDVVMGNDGSGGTFRFVYAVAEDGSVRVIDVTPGKAGRECDAQVDRRYLPEIHDIGLLACMPVGGASTPPRRNAARGPGLRLPFGVLPLDVAIVTSATALSGSTSTEPSPVVMNGTFAVISAQGALPTPRGLLYYANVNDNNYEDFISPSGSQLVDMALAVPHSLRDDIEQRRVDLSATCADPTWATSTRDGVAVGPVRMNGDAVAPALYDDSDYVYNYEGETGGEWFAPMLHRTLCTKEITADAPDPIVIWQLGATAEAHDLITDLGALRSQTWTLAWEGVLQADSYLSPRDGGQVAMPTATTMTVSDPAATFCALGTTEGDILRLAGCNGDSQCGPGETCYVHPDAPASVTGMCVDQDRVASLSMPCRDILTSYRRYTVIGAAADQVSVVTRPWVNTWTPVEGCLDAAECVAIEERQLTAQETAGELVAGSLARHSWTCAEDAAMGPPSRCIMSCDQGCIDGTVCEAGRCVFGPIPPPECVAALQRFEVRAGDAYTVWGSAEGFLAGRTVDELSGACIDDPLHTEVAVGRVRRAEPACVGTGAGDVTPNPCALTLDEPITDADGVISTRASLGVRVRLPGFTFDIADMQIPLSEDPSRHYSPIYPGFYLSFSMVNGFTPFTTANMFTSDGYGLLAVLPDRVRLAPDGSLWVVDAGDNASLGTKGQLIHVPAAGDADTWLK